MSWSITGGREVGEPYAAKGERVTTKRDRFNKLVGEAERLLEEGLEDVSTPIPAGSKAREPARPSPGEAFVTGGEFKMYRASGFPYAASGKQHVGSFIEQKSVPAFTGTIPPADRLAGFERLIPFERLRLRDIVSVARTESNAVEFARVTSPLPTTAAGVAAGDLKPEGNLAVEVASVPIRTIATWVPATLQQLEDVTGLRSLIDTELLGDVLRLVEYEMVFGDGLNEQLLGIAATPNVPTFTRTLPGTPTLADRLKGMITDIVVAGFEPSAIALHPADWETVQLTKTTTGAYLGDVFPANAPQPFLWGLPVVVSHALESYRDGLGVHQRLAVVADFRRATLWTRQAASVEIGLQSDDFVRNKRTVLGEERLAFAVRNPNAFILYETQAASAS